MPNSTKRVSIMRKYQTGVSVVEIIIALGIVGIMTSVSLPALNDYMAAYQADTDAENLLNSLLLARSEAVKRNDMITLCKIDPDSPSVCNNSQGWQSGWIGFVDNDSDGVRDLDETIFDTFTGMGSGTTVVSDDFTNTISYLPSGSISGNGQLIVCVSGSVANAIIINATGRPRIAESVC